MARSRVSASFLTQAVAIDSRSREQLNIENIAPVARLVDGQEVEQQCGKTIVPQGSGNEIVARAEPAAAAAMREQDDPLGLPR